MNPSKVVQGTPNSVEWDPRNPPDTPFFTETTAVERSRIPTEYIRRMEEATRLYAMHREGRHALHTACQIASWTVATQCCWLCVGVWLTVRGYRHANPAHSFVSGMTSNKVFCRVFTPIPVLGLTMMGVTAAQLPRDVKVLITAREGRMEEENCMKSAFDQCMAALAEGRLAMGKEGILTA
ncbi:uncharacterized protein TEOVI_000717100 [Trypanosoma equiperdum]|uniref:Uncharacterized protein n=2 Tax=Trypanozoon TaxID=39700 RepID=Q382I6_TRYB2|nr:hypothetical protein, conserved [Trypanosoma brucei brucei TREU927]EAN80295.1 hypothetical protein, conserved [Trypanosoma brucei brucei TREU927]SCU66284.1 hypothetical protein, conserved [Trypanosoma equiperdum]